MELTLHWFWIISVVASAITLFVVWKAYTTARDARLNGENKAWNKWTTISLILIVLQMISPIKLNPTTNSVNEYSTKRIHQLKVELPPMKMDNSFKQSTNVQGISKGDLK